MNLAIKTLGCSLLFVMTSVMASESGLLIGLRHGSNYNLAADTIDENTLGGVYEPSSYRTFLLQAENGRIELIAERTSLLLPRDDGFWRIDVKHSNYNNFNEDFIWINPAPDSDSLPDPFLAEQEGTKAFDISMLVSKRGINSEVGEYCSGYISRDILYVGTDYLSAGYTRNESCDSFDMDGGMESALQVLSLKGLESVTIDTLLDANTNKTFADTVAKNKSDELGDVSGGIMRSQGQWILKGHLPVPDEVKYKNFMVPAKLPNKISTEIIYPDWKTIKQHVPNAIDALTAPNKEFLIVFTDSGEMLAFNLKGDKISQQPALHILFKKPVALVMSRWAEGQYVSNWMQEIQNLGPDPKQSWFTTADIPSKKKPSKTTGVVIADNLNVNQGIGQHSKPVAKIKKGDKINVLDVLGQWYKVKLVNNTIGYAHSEHIKILPQLPYVNQACPIDNCNYGKWQLNKSAILYSDPSFQSDAITTLAAKQSIQALYGEIHTSQFGEIEVNKNDVKDDNLTLKKGDKLFDLAAISLGVHTVWFNGVIYQLNNGWNTNVVSESDVWGKPVTKRLSDWWVKVEIPEKSLSGWIANPDAEGMVK
ncbi:SH3 domain-containing protein [Candidatus Halobeggiatoa sp. HSG11]|nr:SH3 domain-containing protein [Candidatus Halobeggiatoa sp. HSG11]